MREDESERRKSRMLWTTNKTGKKLRENENKWNERNEEEKKRKTKAKQTNLPPKFGECHDYYDDEKNQ